MIEPAPSRVAIKDERRTAGAVNNATTWADVIMNAWGAAVRSIIETGRLLAEAKAAVAHGEWETLCNQHLPFGESTACKLMKISAHERLSNPEHAPLLPPSWTVLDSLARLDVETFDKALEAGVINPTLERRTAQRLLRGGVAAVIGAEPSKSAAADVDAEIDDDGLDYADKLLAALVSIEIAEAKALSPEARAIITAAARAFGLLASALWRVETMSGPERLRAHQARCLAMYMLHTECSMAQPATAAVFGLEPSSVSRIASKFEDWRADVRGWDDLIESVNAQAQWLRNYWAGR